MAKHPKLDLPFAMHCANEQHSGLRLAMLEEEEALGPLPKPQAANYYATLWTKAELKVRSQYPALDPVLVKGVVNETNPGLLMAKNDEEKGRL
jgi:hypothetical protein